MSRVLASLPALGATRFDLKYGMGRSLASSPHDQHRAVRHTGGPPRSQAPGVSVGLEVTGDNISNRDGHGPGGNKGSLSVVLLLGMCPHFICPWSFPSALSRLQLKIRAMERIRLKHNRPQNDSQQISPVKWKEWVVQLYASR